MDYRFKASAGRSRSDSLTESLASATTMPSMLRRRARMDSASQNYQYPFRPECLECSEGFASPAVSSTDLTIGGSHLAAQAPHQAFGRTCRYTCRGRYRKFRSLG